MYHFLSASRTVLRAQTGKLMVSADEQLYIKIFVAYYLGQLEKAFLNGDLDENCVEKADGTYFVFNTDNGETLKFTGDCHTKYAGVVSGGKPIIMVVRVVGAQRAGIQPSMLLFKHTSRSYPVRGVPDSVPDLFHRTSLKSWMDVTV